MNNTINLKNVEKAYDRAIKHNNTQLIALLEKLVAKFAPEHPIK